jgi:hypothetical protein
LPPAAEVGRACALTLRIQNTSAVLQPLRLLPPASPQFSAAAPRWPTAASGALAPGMWAELQLGFAPESLADHDDCLLLDWQGGRLRVPLRARRPPPVLTLPEVSEPGSGFRAMGMLGATILRLDHGHCRRCCCSDLQPARSWPAVFELLLRLLLLLLLLLVMRTRRRAAGA